MSVTVNNRFGVLLAIKQMNERRNIPLEEVAEATGISRQALYKWKNNSIERVELRVINALCKYFAVQPGDLFEYIPDEPLRQPPSTKQKTARK
jgi:putative transcriptional regulator